MTVAVTVVAVLAMVTPAGAGGWAVSTLDEVPTLVAGTPATVGFTIRQHGITPVALDDVGIEITPPSGRTRFFPATSGDIVGHYTATITIPDAGDHTWTIRQGWFAPQPLGTLTVQPADPDRSGTVTVRSEPVTTRWLPYTFGLTALVLAMVAVGDVLGHRRRSGAV